MGFYNLKIINSGDERVEVYYSKDYKIRTGEVKKNRGQARRYKTKEQVQYEKRKNKLTNLNNSRNKINRLIASNSDLDKFITLTYAESVSMEDSKKQLAYFFTKLRRKQEGLKYIWVLEFQGNGNIHYHILTNLKIDIDTNRFRKSEKHKEVERKFAAVFWKHGFVDIRDLKAEGNTNVAKYLTAYITKDMFNKEMEGKRIFGYSKSTMDKPIVTKILQEVKDQQEILKLFEEYDINFTNSYSIGSFGDKMNYFDMVKKEKKE
jgi:hypothetical protein